MIKIDNFLELFSGTSKGHLTKYIYYSRDVDWFMLFVNTPQCYIQPHDRELINSLTQDNIPLNLRNNHIFEIGAGCKETVLSKSVPIVSALSGQSYTAIDIHHDYAFNASDTVKNFTNIPCNAIEADAFYNLPIAHNDNKIVMLIGSTLGNLVDNDLSHFLKMLNGCLKLGEHFLFTVDTCHDEALLKAYYDNIYLKELCLNIMRFLKDKALADQHFNPELFSLVYNWNKEKEQVELSLKAEASQGLMLDGEPISIEKEQSYHVLTSRKFSIQSISKLAEQYGFKLSFSYSIPNNHMLLAAIEKVTDA